MPIDREKVLQAAQKHVEKKRYDAAIADYQKIIQEDPHDARTLLKIGDLQARLQAYPEAIATYDRVGQYYASQGFSLKAIAVYKQIREIIRKHAPDLADRYAHIGPRLAEIYTQLGLTSDALAAWDEVATRQQRAGRDREAVDVFRKMVELDRGNPLPHLRLGEACCRVQALDEAIDSFWTAADLLLNLGRQEDALKVIERILHFRAEPRYARVAAELYLGRGTRDDGLLALAKLQICFQANPKDLETLGLLGQAFTGIGQDDKAIEVYKEMARVAREQGRVDVYEGLVEHLRAVAPDDEQVRALRASMPSPGASSAPPRVDSESALPIEDGDVEFLEEPPTLHDVEEPMPIPLRSGRPVLSSGPDVVVVDEHLEAVEEVGDRHQFDAHGHSKKAVADAEAFRKLRLYPKAIETLHIALEMEPRSVEIRGKLRDILQESGDRQGAVGETVNLAALHLDAGETALAAELLQRALELDPAHEGALALYDQITPGSGFRGERERARQNRSDRAGYAGLELNAPLPSYDLEQIAPGQARPSRAAPSDLLGVAGTDEPFHLEAQPLPSFPLPESTRALPQLDDLDDISQVEEVAGEEIIDIDALEEVLEEAEFFVARGLFEDARTILNEQLTRTPTHRLVIERLREVDAQLAHRGRSRALGRAELGHGIDLAASLEALDRIELAPDKKSVPGRSRPPAANLGVDADQVFAKFKAGIRAQVSEGDSATHYDLGVAYKEMGLISDAIHELELASRDASRECMCFAMIGMIHFEKNQLDRAAEAYHRALSANVRSAEQELSLHYELGSVHEAKGDPQQALAYFLKVARRDASYRDVRDRVASLKSDKPSSEPSGTRSVNDDDEFERVFDDLFESK